MQKILPTKISNNKLGLLKVPDREFTVYLRKCFLR